MDEIEKLRKQLESLQAKKTDDILSERDCAQILILLKQNKLIDLVYTQDGKEYVTPQRIELDIYDEILAHNGRVMVLDLVSLLNIDISEIEKRVEHLVQHDKTISLVNGDLISDFYLQKIGEEINLALQTNGELSLLDLCKRFSLSSDFLLPVLERKLASEDISGFLDNSILYTHHYIERQQAIIRGIFQGISKPTLLSVIKKMFDFGDKDALFSTLLNELFSSGTVRGHIHHSGERAQYVPDLYDNCRMQWIGQFLNQNGFLQFDTLKASLEMDLLQVKKFLKKHFPQVLLLNEIALGKMFINQVIEEITQVIAFPSGNGCGWFEVSQAVEFPLTQRDIELIIHHVMNLPEHKAWKQHLMIVDEKYIVSKQMVSEIIPKYEDLITEKLAQGSLRMKDYCVAKKASPQISGGRKSKNKRKKRGKEQLHYQEEEKEKTDVAYSVTPEEIDSFLESVIHNNDNYYTDDYGDDQEIPVISGLILSLREMLADKFSQVISHVASSIFLTQTSLQQTRGAEIQKSIHTKFLSLLSFCSTCEKMHSVDGKEYISHHIVTTLCKGICNNISELAHRNFLSPGDASEYFESTKTKSTQNFSISSLLSSSVRKNLVRLNESLKNHDPLSFVSLVETIYPELFPQATLPFLNRRQERDFLFQNRQEIIDMLGKEHFDSRHACALLLCAILNKTFKLLVPLLVPDKNNIAYLEEIKAINQTESLINNEDLTQLDTFVHSVFNNDSPHEAFKQIQHFSRVLLK